MQGMSGKRVYRDNGRRCSGQQPATKSAIRPADKPLVNCGSTAGFVPPPVYIGFPLFVLLKNRSREISSVPWWKRGTDVSWASRTVEVPFGAAWPSFADAPPRPEPPVVCPGFGFGRWIFPNMPCRKGFSKTNNRGCSGQRPGMKTAFRPAYKPVINRFNPVVNRSLCPSIGFPDMACMKRVYRNK